METQPREVEQRTDHLVHAPRRLLDPPSCSRALSLSPSSRRISPASAEHRAHRVAQVVPEDAHHALAEAELARQLLLRLLQLGHVDGGAGEPDDPSDVAQRLIADLEVAPLAVERL